VSATIAPPAPPAPVAAPTAPDGARLYTAGAELRLARPGHEALRHVPLSPDPLAAIATAVADLRADRGEQVTIALDLVPLTKAQARHHRRRARAAAEQRELGTDGGGLSAAASEQWRQAVAAAQGKDVTAREAQPRSAAVRRKAREAAHSGKLSHDQPLFTAQLLIQVTARHPSRAASLIQAVVGSFTAFSGANSWRPAGTRIGPVFLGADSWLHRRSFEKRLTTGLHSPHRDSVVSADEIAGLLKPFTKNCAPRNVARSGGLVPPPPHDLPTYRLGSRSVLPLGKIIEPGGTERLGGAPLLEQLFALILGKSGYGKTELMLAQMIAVAHAGYATWFLDPHRDGIRRALPYLAHEHLAARIWDLDLTVQRDDAAIAGWNPLNMEGRRRDEIGDVVQAIVDGFASALGWGRQNSRALTILSKAAEALADLAWQLARAGRPDLSPTIFQIPSLLGDDEWRDLVVERLDRKQARYWNKTFAGYSSDAVPVVTNAIERLATSRAAVGLLGQPRSGYDARKAIDTGRIVLVTPAGVGENDRLVANMMIFDLFRAAKSRKNIPAERRRHAFTWIDELTAVDGPTIPAIVEQLRKYALHFFAGTQMAGRLSQATQDALLQNVSMLSTSSSEADAARLVTKQWPDVIEPATVIRLPKYQHVMSVTADGASTGPFKVRGAEISELFGPWHKPENLSKLDRVIDRNLARRPLGEVLAEQAELDDKIAEFLAGRE
jgi:hypothetical protein